MTHHDKARELVERLNDTLGGVSVPSLMHGDNLAIVLCTAYDNPDQDVDDETGWTPDAIRGQEAVLAAIRAHYAPLAELAEENQRLREALKPFANAASSIERVCGPRDPDDAIEVRFDALDAARAALSSGEASHD